MVEVHQGNQGTPSQWKPYVLWALKEGRGLKNGVQKGFRAGGTLKSPVSGGLKQEEERTNTKGHP